MSMVNKFTLGQRLWGRFHSSLSLFRLAFIHLFAPFEAVITLGVRGQYEEGRDKVPTGIEVNQHVHGDARLLIVALSDARDRVKRDLMARALANGASGEHAKKLNDVLNKIAKENGGELPESPPPQVIQLVKEMISAKTGTPVENIVAYSGDGGNFKVVHTTPNCDCEVCVTARMESGEATDADRARMN